MWLYFLDYLQNSVTACLREQRYMGRKLGTTTPTTSRVGLPWKRLTSVASAQAVPLTGVIGGKPRGLHSD